MSIEKMPWVRRDGGRPASVIADLEKRMREAAGNLELEEAARLRETEELLAVSTSTLRKRKMARPAM